MLLQDRRNRLIWMWSPRTASFVHPPEA